jgi:hypothetical protein
MNIIKASRSVLALMVLLQCGLRCHGMEFIKVSRDDFHFETQTTRAPFVPWGFNYDRDRNGRLLESYWQNEWTNVVADFQEMKALRANTVRIHLQVSRFLSSETAVNARSLAQLAKVVNLARQLGLYLDITGLGCYERAEVPVWYNNLPEQRRWAVQALFWKSIARCCAGSPAVFCYDLMNEPVLADDPNGREWTPGEFAGKYYVQRITLDLRGRNPLSVGRRWVDSMVSAIRSEDKAHLLTIGAIPWNLGFPGAKPDVYSKRVSKHLDFVSVHFYPKANEITQALDALSAYQIKKPLVIEEMFPLKCSVDDLKTFMAGSKRYATGWITFYWGESIAEYQAKPASLIDPVTAKWLETFATCTAEFTEKY